MTSFLSEHYILFNIISLLSFGIWINLSPSFGFPKLYLFWKWISVVVLCNGLLLYFIDFVDQVQWFNGFFQKDFLDNQVILLLWFLSLMVFFFQFKYSFEFLILFFISFWASMMMISTVDFVMFYFLLELQSMSFYILASFQKTKRISIEGGLKYFFLSSFSSIIMLFGFSFLYYYAGLTNIQDIALLQINIPFTNWIGLLLVLVGFFFKLYCAPFHYWVADIYEGSTSMVVAIFSGLSLLSFFHVLGKFLNLAYLPVQAYWQEWFSYLIPLTIVVGTLGAFYQMKFKRLLAYSSISNTGYFLMGYYYMDSSFVINIYGYIFFYSMSTILLLLVTSMLDPITDGKSDHKENWESWVGIHKINGGLVFLFVVLVFALSGIPPFGVFFGKWYLLSNLFLWGNYSWMLLTVIMTLFTFYYYVRMVKVMTYGKLNNTNLVLKPMPTASLFSLCAGFGVMTWLSLCLIM